MVYTWDKMYKLPIIIGQIYFYPFSEFLEHNHNGTTREFLYNHLQPGTTYKLESFALHL